MTNVMKWRASPIIREQHGRAIEELKGLWDNQKDACQSARLVLGIFGGPSGVAPLGQF